MKPRKKRYVWVFAMMLLAGCSRENNPIPNEPSSAVRDVSNESVIKDTVKPQQGSPRESEEAEITDADWSGYFGGMNGAAVIYDPAEHCYQIYNQELANTRRSPCSTFKIISSLIGLENQVIVPEDSTRQWSKEPFWNDDWNKDINFAEAFRSSCVWYFREVIDEIGKDSMQTELNRLGYGNCDCSDWDGSINTNNQNPALTGFWIESSLKISPKEQTEVMERIFGSRSEYSRQTQNQLKEVMISSEQTAPEVSIYGKTGMGKVDGTVVDAWFTGFSDLRHKRVYFCVYLGESQGEDVSSARAKEIAVKLVLAYSASE